MPLCRCVLLLQLDLRIGLVFKWAKCCRVLGRLGHAVALNGHAIGVLDGAEAGGYPGLAGGDGLTVASAVGAFGEGLTVALDFADASFAFVGVGGDGENGDAGGGGVQDEGDGLGDLAHRNPPRRPVRRLARRFGKGNEKKAAIAVAHTPLSIAWAVMRYDADYIDAGADYYEQRDQRNREHLVRYHQMPWPGSACR